ncbi:putative transposase [Bradyrhizobium sp. JR1.5]
MNVTSNIVALRQLDDIDDPLTNILRVAARQLPAQAVEIELETFLATVKDLKLDDGRARLVRHGYGPARTIATGFGPVDVARAKIRDRGAADGGERIRFSSAILPLRARRTRGLDALLPVLYLRGISTGDFQEALTALLGKGAPNLSPAVISRLTAEWQGEYERWQKRDLSARRYVYAWADGVFLQARMEDHGECMLVLIGATPEGKKELIGLQIGVRESTQSWRELLIDVKQRGCKSPRKSPLVTARSASGRRLTKSFPARGTSAAGCTRRERPRQGPALGAGQHEEGPARSLLGAEPGGRRSGDRRLRREIPRQVRPGGECLARDRPRTDALLAFYDFPAEHWDHLRMTNPIESVFATVRHRTVRTKRSLSSTTVRLRASKAQISCRT